MSGGVRMNAEAFDAMVEKIEKLHAENADMRVRLQKAHGALSVFRHPEDGGHKPRAQWRLNPYASRDFGERYNLAELLEETRPDAEMGLELLVELRELREAAEAVPAIAPTSMDTGDVTLTLHGKVVASTRAAPNESPQQIADRLVAAAKAAGTIFPVVPPEGTPPPTVAQVQETVDRMLLQAVAGAEVADPYGLDQLRLAERQLREESARAADEAAEHRAASGGTSGDRRFVILGRLELAQCRARRAKQWGDAMALLIEKVDGE